MTAHYSIPGATTIGVVCKDGVILASEKRVSYGYMVMSKTGKKVFEISNKIGAACAGFVADMQILIRIMQANAQLFELDHGREMEVKATAKLPTLFMGYNVPVIKTAQKKWQPYALAIIAAILYEGNSSRLNKELVRKQEVAASVSAWYNPFSRLANIFLLVGIPTNKHTIADLKKSFLKFRLK